MASETQDRIRSVIDDLGYATNLAARSMRSHKKNMVGVDHAGYCLSVCDRGDEGGEPGDCRI